MKRQLKYIDLFAGCGGLSTGLHQAGLKGIFAVEKNKSAFLTLKTNLIENRKHFDWPSWLPKENWDIGSLLDLHSTNLKELRSHVDLVVGGPPCQGFSTAGRRHEGDDRNKLVHSYLKFVELVKPSAIMFENVRGFTMKFKANPDGGINYSEAVIRKLKELGYSDARGEVVDMSSYGVPQRRQRFIVIATLLNKADAIFEQLDRGREAFATEKQIRRSNSTKSALSDLEKKHGLTPSPDTAGFSAGTAMVPQNNLQRLLRVGRHDRYTPDSHRFVNHTEDVEKVFVKLLARATRNRCILGDERTAFGLKKRSVTVLSPDEPAPTITTIPDDFVHYAEPRVMTVRECARLQSFPDWFEFKGPYTTGGKQRALQAPRYTQVGNAVPPLFAEQVGLAFSKILPNG